VLPQTVLYCTFGAPRPPPVTTPEIVGRRSLAFPSHGTGHRNAPDRTAQHNTPLCPDRVVLYCSVVHCSDLYGYCTVLYCAACVCLLCCVVPCCAMAGTGHLVQPRAFRNASYSTVLDGLRTLLSLAVCTVLYCIAWYCTCCNAATCAALSVMDWTVLYCSLLFCTVLFCTVLSALLGCNAEIPSQTTGGKCCPHCCTIPLLHYRHCATCSSEVLHCVLYCTVLYCTVLSGRCFHVAGGWRGRRNLVLYFLYMHGDTKPDSKRPRTVSIAPSSRTCG